MVSRILKVALIGASLAALPFTLNQGKITVNDASCTTVTGTCCEEAGSICNAGAADHPGYYYKPSGSCRG